MNYYYIKTDTKNNIVKMMNTPFEEEGYINLTYEEYRQAQLFNKFNSETREFYESKEQQKRDENRLDQIEQAVGALAEQVAKNTLLTGGNE